MQHPALVVHATRGHDGIHLPESVHAVDAIICDGDGRTLAIHGDGDAMAFPRSAIKALQALPLVESGAADAYRFEPRHLALACASHNGEPAHAAGAREMLERAGLSPVCLECGAQLPYHPRDHLALARAGEEPGALHNNCSGKHAGFLALAAHQGMETRGYVRFTHPLQKQIASVLTQATGAEHGDANYGIDGCSIPTWRIPLAALAAAFARFGVGNDRDPARSRAMIRLRDACMAHPEMVAGSERFDTLIMQALPGRVFTKTGAEGVFVACLPELGVAFALKCRDGATRAAEVACAHLVLTLLEEADSTLSQAEADTLKRLANPPILNRNAITVGKVEVVGRPA